jgi:hypothetical protein
MKRPALVVEHRLQIDAPAQRVWSVISELDRYPEWNPFVVACSSTLAVGDPIRMRVRIFPGLAQPQKERILEHEPGRQLCYGVPGSALGALASRRCHEVNALTPASTQYVSRFELKGWLAPLVALLLGRRLAAGFEAMSRALQARAEACGGD